MLTKTKLASALILTCALASCTAGSGRDGTGTGGGGAGTSGAAGAGAAGTGAAGGGNAGAAAGTSGAAGASAAAGTSGAAGTAAPPDGGSTDGPNSMDASAEAAATGCAAPAVICDDFETYADGTTNLAPNWITYTYSGAVRVDRTKPRAGRQSLHLTTQAGARRYADLIRHTRGEALLPQRHFGRMMVWLTSVPPSAHWNLNMSSGPLAGTTDEQVKFLEGGMFGRLMSNYAQRAVPTTGVRGGGPENGDPGADADCAVAAPTQTIAAGRWVCWEWEFDGTADTARLWIDRQPMNEIDAVGSGKQCQGPGFMGRKMMPNYRWESPRVWDKLMIGYEQYQDTPAQELWIDDVVVSASRVGCP